MDVDSIFKIAAIGILVSMLNQVLSCSRRGKQTTMTILARLVVVLMVVTQQISGLFKLVKNLFELQTMKDILKVAAVAIAAAMCTVVVRQRAQEMSLVLSLAAGALALIVALGAVESVCVLMGELGEAAGLSPTVLASMLKTVDIVILTHIPAEVCRNAKESGIMVSMETAGVAVALCVALSLLRAMLDTVTGPL